MKDVNDYIQMLLPLSSKLSVLYVEDDVELQTNMKDLLITLFPKVVCASNGVEALEILKQESFALIITDLNMPKMSGIELIKEIKIKNPEQIILVISAYNQPNYLMPLISMGIENYLIKPYDLQRLTMFLLKSVLVYETKTAKKEKDYLLKQELFALKEENKELKIQLQKLTSSSILEDKTVHESKIVKGNLNSNELVEVLSYDAMQSASRIDEIVESIDFLANKIKNDVESITFADIGDLYFEASKEFSILGALDKCSEVLKELAFAFYDPHISSANMDKIQYLIFIINDNLHLWVQNVLVEQTSTHLVYIDSTLKEDVQTILDLCKV